MNGRIEPVNGSLAIERQRGVLDEIDALNSALREEEHAQDNADGEDYGDDHRKPVEIALHDARSCTGVIKRAGDHIGNTGALAGVHEHEGNERERRERPHDENDDLEGTHKRLLFTTAKLSYDSTPLCQLSPSSKTGIHILIQVKMGRGRFDSFCTSPSGQIGTGLF